MLLDVEETAILNLLEINGRLTFKPDMDVHLRAKKVLIRAGELLVGSEEMPYEHSGTITLYGPKDEPTIAIENQGVEAGSKIIANIGTLRMYGKHRTQTMTRLLREVAKGDEEILVETGLDLVEGDRIALAATGYAQDAGEDNFVESYDAARGVLKLTSPLSYYHWGASESTADDYNGVDMRGEVLILSRNLKVVGEDVESWGC